MGSLDFKNKQWASFHPLFPSSFQPSASGKVEEEQSFLSCLVMFVMVASGSPFSYLIPLALVKKFGECFIWNKYDHDNLCYEYKVFIFSILGMYIFSCLDFIGMACIHYNCTMEKKINVTGKFCFIFSFTYKLSQLKIFNVV